MTARKNSAPISAPSVPVPDYIVVKALSILEDSFMPGDRLTEDSIDQLPPGRLAQLVRTGTLRRQ